MTLSASGVGTGAIWSYVPKSRNDYVNMIQMKNIEMNDDVMNLFGNRAIDEETGLILET